MHYALCTRIIPHYRLRRSLAGADPAARCLPSRPSTGRSGSGFETVRQPTQGGSLMGGCRTISLPPCGEGVNKPIRAKLTDGGIKQALLSPAWEGTIARIITSSVTHRLCRIVTASPVKGKPFGWRIPAARTMHYALCARITPTTAYGGASPQGGGLLVNGSPSSPAARELPHPRGEAFWSVAPRSAFSP